MTGNVKLKSVINGRRTEISISNDLSRSDAPKIAKIASRFIFKGTDVGIEDIGALSPKRAIEVTGEAVVAAGLAGAGLPVNPATVWRGGGRQSQSPQWLFDKDRVDRDVEDGHQVSVPSLSSAIRAGFRADL